MRPHKFLKCGVAITLAAGFLSACVTTKKIDTGTFRTTPEDRGRVLIEAAPYRNAPATRVTYNDRRIIEEYTLYRSSQGQAEVLYTQTTRDYNFNTALDFDKLISTSARMWRFNQNQTLSFSEAFTVKNGITTFWVQPYKQVEAGRDCAGFSASWDVRRNDRQLRPGKIMFGYHCAPKGSAFSPDDAAEFVKSLQIRGVSVPLRVATAYELQKGDPPAPPKDIQLGNLVLAQDGGGGGIAGLPEFPLLIARVYNDIGGPANCNGC